MTDRETLALKTQIARKIRVLHHLEGDARLANDVDSDVQDIMADIETLLAGVTLAPRAPETSEAAFEELARRCWAERHSYDRGNGRWSYEFAYNDGWFGENSPAGRQQIIDGYRWMFAAVDAARAKFPARAPSEAPLGLKSLREQAGQVWRMRGAPEAVSHLKDEDRAALVDWLVDTWIPSEAAPPEGRTVYFMRCGWCGAYEGTVDPTEPCATDSDTGEYIGPHEFGVREKVVLG